MTSSQRASTSSPSLMALNAFCSLHLTSEINVRKNKMKNKSHFPPLNQLHVKNAEASLEDALAPHLLLKLHCLIAHAEIDDGIAKSENNSLSRFAVPLSHFSTPVLG
jgi:hypothetical protein